MEYEHGTVGETKMRHKRGRTQRRKFRRTKREHIVTQVVDFTIDDIHAEVQGRAICRHYQQVIHVPRLRTTYYLDGVPMCTGFKHKKIS